MTRDERTSEYHLRFAAIWDGTCDGCKSQEEGRHYCLLHGITVRNMDLTTCDDWEDRP